MILADGALPPLIGGAGDGAAFLRSALLRRTSSLACLIREALSWRLSSFAMLARHPMHVPCCVRLLCARAACMYVPAHSAHAP